MGRFFSQFAKLTYLDAFVDVWALCICSETNCENCIVLTVALCKKRMSESMGALDRHIEELNQRYDDPRT